MPDNDLLKPCFETPKFPGRYLLFVFLHNSIGGGQQDTLGSYNTLSEIEDLFIIKPEESHPVRFASHPESIAEGYDFIEILDMDERRIVDLNELTLRRI